MARKYFISHLSADKQYIISVSEFEGAKYKLFFTEINTTAKFSLEIVRFRFSHLTRKISRKVMATGSKYFISHLLSDKHSLS